jgi:hypothetical protein
MGFNHVVGLHTRVAGIARPLVRGRMLRHVDDLRKHYQGLEYRHGLIDPLTLWTLLSPCTIGSIRFHTYVYRPHSFRLAFGARLSYSIGYSILSRTYPTALAVAG